MGDRVLFQVKCTQNKKAEFSPVAYGHWCGHAAGDICRALAKRMATRIGDCSYAFARLVQEMVDDDGDALGFGCWNAEALLKVGDSHGEGGIIIIDVTKAPFTFECFGGYMTVGPDGFPVSKYEGEES